MGDGPVILQGGLWVYLSVCMSVNRNKDRKHERLTRFRNWRDDLLDNRGIIRQIDLEWDCSCGVGRIGSSWGTRRVGR